MNLSERLLHIAKMIPESNCIADIGTDHGYIPIYCIKNNICKRAIACDIKEGPIKVANKNIKCYGLNTKIETRVGPGLKPLKEGEVDTVIVAGMGGNLIVDIINDSIDLSRQIKNLVLQPMQHPEVLRKYLVCNGFNIVDEDIVEDGKKYYHIMKVHTGESCKYEKEVYYYTGIKLIEKKHQVLKNYVEFKISQIENIIYNNKGEMSERHNYLIKLRDEFKDVIKCL